jgi:hypothetical protein
MPNYRNRAGTGVVETDLLKIGGVLQPRTVLSGTFTYDPPSMTTGAVGVSSGITITGVALGDHIDLYPPYDTQGISVQAQASAANTIVISLHNRSAGTVDLASGLWGYAVKRRV